jgi:O-antigen ligase
MQIEALAICAFAFVLPQFEAPKNLLWVVYALLWLVNRWRARDFGGPWDAWDSLIATWIASGYITALFAGLHNSEWGSAMDVLRYGSILWLLRRSGYTEDTLKQLAACLLFGTLAALLRGYYELLFVPRADQQPRNLGLNSVGHVNHSAIYLAIAFGATVAWVRGAWRSYPLRHRVLAMGVCAALLLSIFVMASRATVAVSLLVAFLLLTVYALRSGKRLWKIVTAIVIIILAMAILRPEVVEKNSLRMKQNIPLAFRDSIWRAGIEAWREFPVFGVGMGNYGKINYALLEQWRTARGEGFDRSQLLPQSHAHSLYINTLAERGGVGLLVLFAVLAAWAHALWRGVPSSRDGPVTWAYWGGALTAWLVATLVGLVNTTLHHEHALISMLLLGGWLSLRHPRSHRRSAPS